MNQPVRTLRRLPQEKKVAGVCAGLARYAGVDQVLVRLGFVLLTVLGGSGLLLYLVAWVIMPKADPHEPLPVTAPAPRSTILGLVGLAVGVAVVFGDWSFGPGNRLLPLLLIGGAVYLLLQREDNGAVRTTPDMPYGMGSSRVGDAVGGDAGPGFTMPSSTAVVDAGSNPLPAGGVDTAEVPAASDWYRAQTEARAELGLPPLPRPARSPGSAGRPRQRPAGAGGRCWWCSRWPSSCCSVRSPPASVPSYPAGPGAHLPTDRVGAPHAGYELGVGELVLDLTALPPLTEDRSVSLDLGMGQVRVILPPELDVELEAHAGMGEIVPPAGPDESQDGVDVTLTTRDDGDAPAGAAGGTASDTSGGDDGPVLHLAAEVGMGQVEVTRR
ncbi:MAG: PspC domain-containing protein [Acidimicrobiales bacterium]